MHASLPAALDLPVANTEPTRPAFHVRFAIPASVPSAFLEDAPGWRRVRSAKDTGWFSWTNRDAFRKATRDVLHWRRDSDVPSVLELDLGPRLSRSELVGLGLPRTSLASVDLVPFAPIERRAMGFNNEGRERVPAMLGIVVEGGPMSDVPLTVGGVLELVGARRKLWSFELDDGSARTKDRPDRPTLGAFAAEIRAAIEELRAPAWDALTCRRWTSPDSSFVVNVVHVPEEPWRLHAPTSGEGEGPGTQALADAAAMLLTAARPRPEYPKLAPGTRRFMLPQSPASLYAIHDLGFGALLGPTGERFNQTQKPRLVMEAHYLQWLVARQLPHVVEPRPAAIVGSYERAPRKAFMDEALAFYGFTKT